MNYGTGNSAFNALPNKKAQNDYEKGFRFRLRLGVLNKDARLGIEKVRPHFIAGYLEADDA